MEALRCSPGSERDIENAGMIYDAIVKTGNNALDTILPERILFCDKTKSS